MTGVSAASTRWPTHCRNSRWPVVPESLNGALPASTTSSETSAQAGPQAGGQGGKHLTQMRGAGGPCSPASTSSLERVWGPHTGVITVNLGHGGGKHSWFFFLMKTQ